ncbi:hypothetical protein Tco_0789693 [Tanacetum coccineum]
MSEEDQNVEVVLPVKSDMHSYSSTMTAKDVKALAFKHNIPLDLHPVDGLAGIIDSDIHDLFPTDGFRASDVVTLTNQSIDIRPVLSELLFHAGLATTWEFSGFLLIFKDTEGNG